MNVIHGKRREFGAVRGRDAGCAALCCAVTGILYVDMVMDKMKAVARFLSARHAMPRAYMLIACCLAGREHCWWLLLWDWEKRLSAAACHCNAAKYTGLAERQKLSLRHG